MRRTSLGKCSLPGAQRLRRAHFGGGPRPSSGCGAEGPRRAHRLGRTGVAGGVHRPPNRAVVLRQMDLFGYPRMSGRQITSLTNPTVKAVRALHMRKEREESGLFLAEGLKIVIEAIDLGHAP